MKNCRQVLPKCRLSPAAGILNPAVHVSCVSGACDYMCVKFSDLVAHAFAYIMPRVCVNFISRKKPLLSIHSFAFILQNKKPLYFLILVFETHYSLAT